jgi:hypothetical protein
MSLSARYSLLTLLVLLALIAGGVKFWFGPHRVVERTKADEELEYTYTRDWRGNKTIDGPYVTRSNLNQKYPTIDIAYYRQGGWLNWNYSCYPTDDAEGEHPVMLQTDSPLLPQEWLAFHRTVEIEKQRAYPPGTRIRIFEGAMNVFTF